MTSVAWVLASAVLHAAWNSLLKHQSKTEGAVVGVLFFAVLLSAVVAVGLGKGFDNLATVAYTVAAGLVEGGYFACLGRSLRLAPLGRVYALTRGAAVLCLWPLSIFWLGEKANALALLGAALVVGGLWLGSAWSAGPGADERHPRAREGYILALIAAVCLALYNFFYKLSLDQGGHPASLFALSMAIALPFNLVVLGREGMKQLLRARRESPWWALTAVICCLSFWMFLFALERGGAARLTTLRNTSVFAAQLMALGLGEKVEGRLWAGAVVLVAGAVLLAVPA